MDALSSVGLGTMGIEEPDVVTTALELGYRHLDTARIYGNSLYVTFLPTWLENTLGMSGPAIAGIFLVGGVANVTAGPRAGSLSDRVGRKPIIVGASVGIATGMSYSLRRGHRRRGLRLFLLRDGSLFDARDALSDPTDRDGLGERTRRADEPHLRDRSVRQRFWRAVAAVAYTTVGYLGTTVIAALAMLVIAGLVWRYLPETVGSEAQSPTTAVGEVATTVTREVEHAEDTVERSVERFLCRQTPDALYGPCHEAGHADGRDATVHPTGPTRATMGETIEAGQTESGPTGSGSTDPDPD